MTQEIEDWEWHENRELESKVPNVTQFPIIEEKIPIMTRERKRDV